MEYPSFASYILWIRQVYDLIFGFLTSFSSPFEFCTIGIIKHTKQRKIKMSATLLINFIGSPVTWSLALLDKYRPFFLRDMPLTQGTKQFQDAVPASKPATEKRSSLRTEPHTLSSSFFPLQVGHFLRREIERNMKISPKKYFQGKARSQREDYCLRTESSVKDRY